MSHLSLAGCFAGGVEEQPDRRAQGAGTGSSSTKQRSLPQRVLNSVHLARDGLSSLSRSSKGSRSSANNLPHESADIGSDKQASEAAEADSSTSKRAASLMHTGGKATSVWKFGFDAWA